MKFLKLSLITFTITAFLTGCGSGLTGDTASVNQYPADVAATEGVYAEDGWAKENLDLQAVGALLEKADNAEEFEYLLNSTDSVNNLDLNGDGYADYISVREFDDRDDNQRGFSLFSMFGPNEIQEIASLIFNRQNRDNRDSRVFLYGNDQIYGDDNYYESNWVDRSLPIVNWVFNDRDTYYRSPYYYDNYPDYYETYRVVETPVYRTRIEQYYAAPVFIKTNPAMTMIKIKSPHNGKSLNKIYAKLAKPSNEQIEFRKNNPNRPKFVPVQNGKTKNGSIKADDQPKGNPNRFEKFEKKNVNPVKIEKPNIKPPKQVNNGKQNNGKGGGKGGGKKN